MNPIAAARIALLAALLVAAPTPAIALGEEARVLVISTGAGDPVTEHLINELVSLGITVEVTPAIELNLARLSRERRAVAALRVAPSRRALTLWVAPSAAPTEPSAPEPAEQVLDEPSGDANDAAASLALRAVELLRARLRARPQGQKATSESTAETPGPTRAAAIPTVESDARARAAPSPRAAGEPNGASSPRRKRFLIAMGPGVVVQPGSDISVGGSAIGGFRWMITPRISGDALVVAPLVPSVVTAPGGEVRLSATLLGGGGFFDFIGGEGPLSMGAGAGLAAGLLTFDAEATTAKLRGMDGTTAYAMPYVRWALSWRAMPPLGIRADAIAGVTAPRPVIRAEGRDEDAIFGRPLLVFGLGVEVTLP